MSDNALHSNLHLTLKRQSLLRKKPDQVAGLHGHPDARVLLFWDQRLHCPPEGWGRLAALADSSTDMLIFLGEYAGQPTFALELATPESAGLNASVFEELRSLALRLSAEQLQYVLLGKALLHWHREHRFCGRCGSETAIREAGHSRLCGECGAQHFPRTDPAIIVAVTCQDQILLGRQASWPEGRYSTLAGFVEPGETLEQAVAREVFEEAGVRVQCVQYFRSQPWPFPQSLMLAFFAEADSFALDLQDQELEHADWWSRERYAAELVSGRLGAPSRVSVSYQLIQHWYERDGARLRDIIGN